MKLSRQHKVYLGILGVALFGLIADRTMFQPSEVAAESPQDLLIAPTEPGGGPAAAKAAHAPAAIPIQPIAARLKSIAPAAPLDAATERDVFSVPWEDPNTPMPMAARDEPTPEEISRSFMSRHRLTAVMGTGPRGYGVIDGKLVHVGDTFDGLVLQSVSTRSATFVSGPTQVELNLFRQGSDGTNQARSDSPS